MEVAAAEAGQGDKPVPPRSLRAIARGLLDRALTSDAAAREVADRIDGKVPQAHVGDDEHDPIGMVHRIERIIIAPSREPE
jgi:hypothetical protein